MEKLSTLKNIDPSIFYKFLGLAYYSVFYLVIGMFVGSFIDKYIPKYDEKKEIYVIFLEVILQSIINVICIYLIRIVVQSIPSPINTINKVKTPEYSGGVTLATIFYITQKNYIDKILHLEKYIEYYI